MVLLFNFITIPAKRPIHMVSSTKKPNAPKFAQFHLAVMSVFCDYTGLYLLGFLGLLFLHLNNIDLLIRVC